MTVVKKALKKRVKATISADDLLKALPSAKKVTFDPKTVIFREDSPATDCFFITEGKVRILKKSSRGEALSLAIIKPGDFLGEMAMLSGQKRSATAVAMTEVKALVIGHKEFVSLLQGQNPFASRLSLQISIMLALRCHHLLGLIARKPEVVPLGARKASPVNVRAVLNRVYTLWAV